MINVHFSLTDKNLLFSVTVPCMVASRAGAFLCNALFFAGVSEPKCNVYTPIATLYPQSNNCI